MRPPGLAGCSTKTPRRRRDSPRPPPAFRACTAVGTHHLLLPAGAGRRSAAGGAGMPSFKSVAVIGAGAWGTALAAVAARAGRDVVLYARDAASAAYIARTRGNPKLPDLRLAANIAVSNEMTLAAAADIILIATPAQHLREAIAALAPYLAAATPVIACAKGIERGTHKFMTEVIAETAPNTKPAILSGPGFAEDVARGLPTAVTLAAHDEELAGALVQALGCSTFRPYHTTDVRG